MSRRPAPLSAALAFIAACAGLVAPARAAAPEPAQVVTTADLHEVLGGKWTTSSPEPGVLICEEQDGYRVVNVYLSPANGKSIAGMLPGHREMGETVDELAGLGDGAMYRPQYGEATVEKKDAKTGEVLWLSVSIHNVDDPAARKDLAVALARLVAAKL